VEGQANPVLSYENPHSISSEAQILKKILSKLKLFLGVMATRLSLRPQSNATGLVQWEPPGFAGDLKSLT